VQRVEVLGVKEPKMLRIEMPKTSRKGGEWEGYFPPQLARSLGKLFQQSPLEGGALAAKTFW